MCVVNFTDLSLIAGVVLWSRECVGIRAYKNPVMTFPIKKRINTELMIGRMAALYL